jgi:hypothetical protein
MLRGAVESHAGCLGDDYGNWVFFVAVFFCCLFRLAAVQRRFTIIHSHRRQLFHAYENLSVQFSSQIAYSTSLCSRSSQFAPQHPAKQSVCIASLLSAATSDRPRCFLFSSSNNTLWFLHCDEDFGSRYVLADSNHDTWDFNGSLLVFDQRCPQPCA